MRVAVVRSSYLACDPPILRASSQAYNCWTRRNDRVRVDHCTRLVLLLIVVPGLWRRKVLVLPRISICCASHVTLVLSRCLCDRYPSHSSSVIGASVGSSVVGASVRTQGEVLVQRSYLNIKIIVTTFSARLRLGSAAIQRPSRIDAALCCIAVFGSAAIRRPRSQQFGVPELMLCLMLRFGVPELMLCFASLRFGAVSGSAAENYIIFVDYLRLC